MCVCVRCQPIYSGRQSKTFGKGGRNHQSGLFGCSHRRTAVNTAQEFSSFFLLRFLLLGCLLACHLPYLFIARILLPHLSYRENGPNRPILSSTIESNYGSIEEMLL